MPTPSNDARTEAKNQSHDAGDGFGLLRIVAAIMVVFAHSFPTANGSEDPTWRSHGLVLAFGSAAVDIFFVISGYLVVASWLRDPSAFRFVVRRVTRIWPGLLVMLLVTTFAIGSLVTTLHVGVYLTAPATWRYLLGSALLLPVWTLPGVFETNFAPGVNGSIWTLPIEVTAYAGVLVFGWVVVANGRRLVMRAAMVAVGALLASVLLRDVPPQQVRDGFLYLTHQRFLAFFLVGAVLFMGRRRIPMTGPLFALAMAALIGSLIAGLELPVYVLFAYGVIYLSTRRGYLSHRLTAMGDPSYGIYIYGYPLQQLLAHLRLAPNPWIMFVEAAVLAVGAGYLSWHLVERRALAFARRVLSERQPRVVAKRVIRDAA